MGKLTQPRFAKLLAEAMDTVGLSGVAIGKATGIHETTISRYRSPDYPSGPPKLAVRRALEDALGLKTGYLDGTTDVDLAEVARSRRLRGNGEGVLHDGKTLRAALATIRGQLQMALRQLELAEMVAGMEASPLAPHEDPAAEARLVETGEAKKPAARRRPA